MKVNYLLMEGEGCLWKFCGLVVILVLIGWGPIGWLILAVFFIARQILISRYKAKVLATAKIASLSQNPDPSDSPPNPSDPYLASESVEEMDNAIRDALKEMTQPELKSSPAPIYTPSPPNLPDDLDNILREIEQGNILDPVTHTPFTSGEKLYLCLVHRLAYHANSWQSIGCKCQVCGHGKNTKLYTLPRTIELIKSPKISQPSSSVKANQSLAKSSDYTPINPFSLTSTDSLSEPQNIPSEYDPQGGIYFGEESIDL